MSERAWRLTEQAAGRSGDLPEPADVVGYAPLPSPPRNRKVRAMDDTTLDDIPAEELQDLLLALREALRSRALNQQVRDHLQELYDDLEQGRARVLRGTAAAWRTRGRST